MPLVLLITMGTWIQAWLGSAAGKGCSASEMKEQGSASQITLLNMGPLTFKQMKQPPRPNNAAELSQEWSKLCCKTLLCALERSGHPAVPGRVVWANNEGVSGAQSVPPLTGGCHCADPYKAV